MKIFQTKAYKVIMGYIYGWGATAVIIGALFKIMHFPGAGIVLTVGMVVEAVIFALSAFEPPMEHYDWARVFPSLGKDQAASEGDGAVPAAVAVPATGAPVQAGNVNANIDLGLEAGDLDRLKAGIDKFAQTAEEFAGIVGNAPEMADRMAKVSDSFNVLGEQTQKMSETLEASVSGLSSGYTEINRMLQESAQALTEKIRENCEKLASGMGESASNFTSLTKLMDEQIQQVKSSASDYTQQLTGVSKNIGALNALYELQLRETKDCLESFRGMQGDMGEMLENVSLSLDSTKLFKQESQQLANNIASLNSVYGNMLSVVNNN